MTTDTLAKLAACPFCGSEALFCPDGEEEGHSIMCSGNKDDHKDCPISAFRFEATIEQASEAWNRHALPAQAPCGKCDECGKGQLEGWALYCVDCLEKTGLLAKEALPNAQRVSSTAADLTDPNDTAAQAPTLTDHEIELSPIGCAGGIRKAATLTTATRTRSIW